MNSKKLFVFFCIALTFFSLLNAQSLSEAPLNNTVVTGEKYVSGQDGIVRIYVNIWGHVKYPGTYLVYDGINLVNALSLAGGPLEGANLKKVKIISQENSQLKLYNLEEGISKVNKLDNKKIDPFDTIFIEQTIANKVLSRSALITAVLQLVNLIYTIENLDSSS
tara:strand:- start:13616 stop:14110 length:495 start_codon:yes stop_codon:yes gene_type:complete